jgi:hypothetical protein
MTYKKNFPLDNDLENSILLGNNEIKARLNPVNENIFDVQEWLMSIAHKNHK